MKTLETFKLLGKTKNAQLFHYYIYRMIEKNVIVHPAVKGAILNTYNFQNNLNNKFSYILNNLDDFSINPKKYLKYIEEGLLLNRTFDQMVNIYKTELSILNITPERLKYFLSGEEHNMCLKEFERFGSIDSILPQYLSESNYIEEETFNRRCGELCKRFGLAGIIAPKFLQNDTFLLNIEKNLSFLTTNALLQTQALGNLKLIISIDDSYYSGLPEDLYKNINVKETQEQKIITFNSDSFLYTNFIDIPNSLHLSIVDNLDNKSQLKM